MLSKIPIKNPKPNSKQFINILMGKENGKPPLIEYLIDDVVLRPIIENLLNRNWIDYSNDRSSQKAYLDNYIQVWYKLGYDVVRYERGLDFSRNVLFANDKSFGENKQRAWANEHQGVINSWEDLEKYKFPKISDYDFFPIEYINNNLPEGMGFITCHAGGIFEHLSSVMSLEGLSFAIYENPELVKAVVDKIGELITKFYEHILQLDKLTAILQGDDMGYKSGTIISPKDLKRFCLPWQKKLADMTHKKGFPYFLHSCGNLQSIMDDLINDVGIDGKHSYEDIIMPVEKFQEKFGDKIAVLGGVDLNILSSKTPDEVRKRAKELLYICGERGRFALGAGNSIASYVPIENYLAMVDEANIFKES